VAWQSGAGGGNGPGMKGMKAETRACTAARQPIINIPKRETEKDL